jgi:thiosulfate/3-mercaptopyruvate sulfurtransferase
LRTIIDSESLYKRINSADPNLLLLDIRPFSDYNKGHIPGAINIDLMHFHWFDTSSHGIKEFNRQMKILLNFIGINYQSLVVFYDDISGASASRGVWLLHYFSHGNTYILDGGFKRWIELDYPIEEKTNSYKHSKTNFTIEKNVLADVLHIKNKIKNNQKEIEIIDCRSEMEFNGTLARALKRGHIPGAINVDWTNNLDTNKKFKERSKLLELYSFIPFDKETITYCQGGYRAANTYLILKQLGYSNVKMYLGSWGEWGNIPLLPTEQ